jgi:hypothetical protein
MASQKLTHAAFWDRMDRATRHVGRLPDWVKGSPNNERLAASSCGPDQGSATGSGSDSAIAAKQDDPLPPRQ